MSNEVSDALRLLVAERAYHVCEYCLVHEEDVYHGCEVDHVRSVKHGGLTVDDNLALACFHCNRHKGADLGSVSVRTETLVRFYNPRTDRWKVHFCWIEARIEPLTDIGEVTEGSLTNGVLSWVNPSLSTRHAPYWPRFANVPSRTSVTDPLGVTNFFGIVVFADLAS